MFKFSAKFLHFADDEAEETKETPAKETSAPRSLLTPGAANPKTKKQYAPSLVTKDNPKTEKGEEQGWLTGIMHLAPSDLSGRNVCPHASPECRSMCLNTAGNPVYQKGKDKARIQRTKFYFTNRPEFLNQLRGDIKKLIAQAEKKGLKPAIRINGTSDLPHVARQMAKEFPNVQFYDYTKIPEPWTRTLPNYHITFSRSENNEHHALKALEHGVNVAVVFGIGKSEPLPEKWHGYYVLDGDKHDLRFLDDAERPDPSQPLVIGLRAKGKARGQGSDSGFVVNPKPEELIQIQKAKASFLRPKKASPRVEFFAQGMFA